MEAKFTKAKCPKCEYLHADKKATNDGSEERLTCLRCGYHYVISEGEKTEHQGLGSWCIVGASGIGVSAIYTGTEFFDNIEKIYKTFTDGRLFYTKFNHADKKYYLLNPKSANELEFSDDAEICFEGLRRINKKK